LSKSARSGEIGQHAAMAEIFREPMDSGFSVVVVSGAADTSAGPQLRAALEESLVESGARLIVDLTKASFIDSAMLGILAATYERNPPPEGRPPRMAVVCPEGDVRSMFEITALDTLLPVRETVESAFELMSRGDSTST
jgi:anti-anti-sigma factor